MSIFIAILTDLGTLGNYILYGRNLLQPPLPLIIQSALFVVAFIAMCAYKGPRTFRRGWQMYPIFTFRFSVIILSLVVNASLIAAIVLKMK